MLVVVLGSGRWGVRGGEIDVGGWVGCFSN